MAKITRYSGNLKAFGADAQGSERVVFGTDDAPPVQSDDLTENINSAALRGWGSLPLGRKPPREWFNSVHWIQGQLAAYLHQAGVAEWHSEQEYYENGFASYNGQLWRSLSDDNVDNTPSVVSTHWALVSQVEGVTALQAASLDLSEGTVVSTVGYSSQGDYGSSKYIVVAGGTGTADGGSYIDMDNGKQLRAVFGVSINVQQFGAVPGTDCTAAFQAAIDYSNAKSVRCLVPYDAAAYQVSSLELPPNNVVIEGDCYTKKLPEILHTQDTGYLFGQTTGSTSQHSLVFKNLKLTGSATRTTSAGIYIPNGPGPGLPYGIRIINVRLDNFGIGVYIPECFHSQFEWMEPSRCDVGFYGGEGIDNRWINNVASSTPQDGVAFWLLGGASCQVQTGDTKDFSAGDGAYQYLVGNDTSVAVPVGAQAYISAESVISQINFYDTHFEFSDGAGAGTVQAGFVRVGVGSKADFNNCHFMNRTPNLPHAVDFRFLNARARFFNCYFPTGPADQGGTGSYAVSEIVLTSRSRSQAGIHITPDSYDSTPQVTGFTDVVFYDVQSGARVKMDSVQTVQAGTTEILTFESRDFDLYQEFDTTSHLFTATHPGIYSVDAMVYVGGSNPPVTGDRYRLELKIDGTDDLRADEIATNADSFSLKLNGKIRLAAGETVSLHLNNTDSASDIDVSANGSLTSFSIIKEA